MWMASILPIPGSCPNAIKIDEITYDEMLELASLGANVLHNRSVEMAKKYNVNLEVLSSMTGAEGTIVKEVTDVEKLLIKGVTKDVNIARISAMGVSDQPGYRIPSVLAAGKAQGQRGYHSPVGGPGRYPGHQLHRGCQGRR